MIKDFLDCQLKSPKLKVKATLADFLRKSKLVSVLCGSHKNFNRKYKIKGRVKKFLNVQRHMSLPRPYESYHFQANLSGETVPLKSRRQPLALFTKVF
jgi:hypothetical protein